MNSRVALHLTAGTQNKRLYGGDAHFDALSERDILVQSYNINTHNLFYGFLYVLLLSIRFRPVCILATEYYCTFFSAFASHLIPRARLISISLNQSRRILRFRSKFLNKIVNRVFDKVEKVIVHSRREALQFGEVHGLPFDRFVFSHWGFDLPEYVRISEPHPKVVMVGRNNRDFAVFITAIEAVNTSGLIIAPKSSGLSSSPSRNVSVLFDLPMELCVAHMEAAEVNVVCLLDETRGAGHITLVTAMHLGKAQVVSAATQIDDYVIDGHNGKLVPIGNAEELEKSIHKLLTDRDLSSRFGRNGYVMAKKFMSHDAVLKRVNEVIESVFTGSDLDFVKSSWTDFLSCL